MEVHIENKTINANAKVFAIGQKSLENRALSRFLSLTKLSVVPLTVAMIAGQILSPSLLQDKTSVSSITTPQTYMREMEGVLKQNLWDKIRWETGIKINEGVQKLSQTSLDLNDQIDEMSIRVLNPQGYKENQRIKEAYAYAGLDLHKKEQTQHEQMENFKASWKSDTNEQKNELDNQLMMYLQQTGYVTKASPVESYSRLQGKKEDLLVVQLAGTSYNKETKKISMVDFQKIQNKYIDENVYLRTFVLLHETGHASLDQLNQEKKLPILNLEESTGKLYDEAYGDAFASLSLLKLTENNPNARHILKNFQQMRYESHLKNIEKSHKSYFSFDPHNSGYHVIETILQKDPQTILNMSPEDIRYESLNLAKSSVSTYVQQNEVQQALKKDPIYHEDELIAFAKITPQKFRANIEKYRQEHKKEQTIQHQNSLK